MSKRAKRRQDRVGIRTPVRRRQSRRSIAVATIVLVAIVGVIFWLRRAGGPAIVRTADQNVLLVTIDTLRADALGSYGGVAATPALDGLAASGIRYTFAHAHAPVTLVSHASMLSGLYPFQHGVRDNSGFRFPSSIPTLASRLKAAGFATGAFIGAFPLHSQFGLNRDFDVYDESFKETALPADFALSERPATAVVAAARPWIARQRGRWFAWVHVFEPHAPYAPAEPFKSRYAGNPYAGEVATADAALAPLLADVRAISDRPTLVIVTGDHGESLGEHGELTHGLFAYESTLRVPFIVAQVGGQRTETAGAVSDDPVRHVDIVPTVLDAVERPAEPALPGRSLLTPAPQPASVTSYFEALSASLNRGWAPLTGVIVGRDKLVELPIAELYDLQKDAREEQNVFARENDRRRILEARLKDLQATGPSGRQEENAETRAQLNALGYVTGTGGAPHKGPYTENDDPKRLIAIDQQIHDAIDLFQKGDSARAAALYREIIARRPDMATGYEHLAFVTWEMGRPDEAIATLQRAIAMGVSNAEIESKLGMYLTESGRVKEGLPLLERAANRPPADIDTLNALAIGYARSGQSDRALATFKGVLEIDSRNAMALQNVGSVELERHNAAAARDAFRRALDADPNWAPAYTGLGVAERRLNNLDAAIASWKKAVELDPREFDALYNLTTELASAGRTQEARVYAERFVATAPGAYQEDVETVRRLLKK
jgi:arylsulfatase A-like enzyme/Tfp pilus assembly protein PilF